VIKANGLACCRHESYSASKALSRSCPPLLWLSAVLFFGAAYAALAIGVWLPLFEGEIAIPTLFSSPDWHVQEMLFGYVPAIVTGFLLTAIPNWTGRLPLQGIPLLILVVAWGAKRVEFSAMIPNRTGYHITVQESPDKQQSRRSGPRRAGMSAWSDDWR
jgi:uncharacterized protein involved in response to NO